MPSGKVSFMDQLEDKRKQKVVKEEKEENFELLDKTTSQMKINQSNDSLDGIAKSNL